jgi:hypothetical protein
MAGGAGGARQAPGTGERDSQGRRRTRSRRPAGQFAAGQTDAGQATGFPSSRRLHETVEARSSVVRAAEFLPNAIVRGNARAEGGGLTLSRRSRVRSPPGFPSRVECWRCRTWDRSSAVEHFLLPTTCPAACRAERRKVIESTREVAGSSPAGSTGRNTGRTVRAGRARSVIAQHHPGTCEPRGRRGPSSARGGAATRSARAEAGGGVSLATIRPPCGAGRRQRVIDGCSGFESRPSPRPRRAPSHGTGDGSMPPRLSTSLNRMAL